MKISAAELKVGDIIHQHTKAHWRVDSIIIVGKGQIQIVGTYTHWAWGTAEDRVGQEMHWKYRPTTILTITR